MKDNRDIGVVYVPITPLSDNELKRAFEFVDAENFKHLMVEESARMQEKLLQVKSLEELEYTKGYLEGLRFYYNRAKKFCGGKIKKQAVVDIETKAVTYVPKISKIIKK